MTHAQSGDKVWWFDFSSVTRWGEYYIYDPANDTRSARFRIDHDVYEDVLKQAVRMYYYQRRGAAKTAAVCRSALDGRRNEFHGPAAGYAIAGSLTTRSRHREGSAGRMV